MKVIIIVLKHSIYVLSYAVVSLYIPSSLDQACMLVISRDFDQQCDMRSIIRHTYNKVRSLTTFYGIMHSVVLENNQLHTLKLVAPGTFTRALAIFSRWFTLCLLNGHRLPIIKPCRKTGNARAQPIGEG